MPFFNPAFRKKSRGRITFAGPAGSGKTFTSLRLAHALSPNGKIAIINTESGAVEKYLGLNPDGIPWNFDVGYLQDNSPTSYTTAILEAARSGYQVLIIDSLSHAWYGSGGALELVDKKGGSKFYDGWREVTPMHNRMIDAILGSPCHVIATLRTKTVYVVEEYIDREGQKKSAPRRIGMAPIQRAGMEYEFDIVADMDITNTLTVGKTRCSAMRGQISVMPGADFFAPFVDWLNEGAEVDPSFYIASEADLNRSELARKQREADAKKIERQQEAAIKAAEKEAAPKVDAKQLIRQKAAERAAAQAAKEATANQQDGSAPGDTGADSGEGAAASQPADGQAVSEGDRSNGDSAESPSEPSSDTSNASGNGEAAQPSNAASPPNIDQLVSRIDEYGPRVYGDQWPDAKAAVLKKHGVGRLKSLSVAVAETLLEKLMAKSMGMEKANEEVHARAAGESAAKK